jgi:hypothetical protein
MGELTECILHQSRNTDGRLPMLLPKKCQCDQPGTSCMPESLPDTHLTVTQLCFAHRRQRMKILDTNTGDAENIILSLNLVNSLVHITSLRLSDTHTKFMDGQWSEWADGQAETPSKMLPTMLTPPSLPMKPKSPSVVVSPSKAAWWEYRNQKILTMLGGSPHKEHSFPQQVAIRCSICFQFK